jgi:hypothetical protein
MSSRLIAAIPCALLAISCASCSGTAEGLSQVNGKVLSQGQPAAGAVLLFHHELGGDPPPPKAASIVPSAVVREDGSFRVESQPLGFGAAPGRYNILVQWPEGQDTVQLRTASKSTTTNLKGKKVTVTKHDKLDPVPIDRLKGRYADAKKPVFKAEIKAGSNDLGTFELEMKP